MIRDDDQRGLPANRVEGGTVNPDETKYPQKPQINGKTEGNQSAPHWNAPGFWQAHQKHRSGQAQQANLAQRAQADHHGEVLKPTTQKHDYFTHRLPDEIAQNDLLCRCRKQKLAVALLRRFKNVAINQVQQGLCIEHRIVPL